MENPSSIIEPNLNTPIDYNDSHYNYSNYSYIEPPNEVIFSPSFKIVIYIIYNSVFVSAVLGNLLVCYVVMSEPRMRTVTNYLIANLAVGDLLMAIFCVPSSYIILLYQYWPFGHIMCILASPAQGVFVFVSSYTLVALAGDRYVAILYPLRPRLRRSQALIVIGLIWVVAALTAIPIMITTTYLPDDERPLCKENWDDWLNLQVSYSLTLMVLQYFFPLIVLISTYTRIALAVWGKRSLGETGDARDIRLEKAKRKTVVVSLAVVAGYTLAWLPFNILHLTLDLFPTALVAWESLYIPFFACNWLAMAHTAYNPLIYAFLNSNFRESFKRVLRRMSICCPSPSPNKPLPLRSTRRERPTLRTTTPQGPHSPVWT